MLNKTITIKKLLTGLDSDIDYFIDKDKQIANISLDSRTITKNDVFVALDSITGNNNGIDYALDALNNGACLILVDKNTVINNTIVKNKVIKLKNLVNKLDILAIRVYQNANNKTIIATTGTNGKSTVSCFIMQLLNHLLPNSSASIGTLGVQSASYSNIIDINKSTQHTTPDIFSLYKILHYTNYKYYSIEASSHALAQNRLAGLFINSAIFTNITKDHLDYHTTMDNYFASKLKLFNKDLKTMIINYDDSFGKKIYQLNSNAKKIAYGLDKNSKLNNYYTFDSYKTTKNGFLCSFKGNHFKLPLLGLFNLYNILATISFAYSLGFDIANIIKYLTKLKPPKGRMQKINNSLVWIDFAHTPDALYQALLALKNHYPYHNIVLVFGCGGDRDTSKRQQMGAIADKLANSIILTSDNSRSESSDKIIQDIDKGINNSKTKIIIDRKEAITYAITNLVENECLLIAGRGCEEYQIIGSKKTKLNDIEIANYATNNTK